MVLTFFFVDSHIVFPGCTVSSDCLVPLKDRCFVTDGMKPVAGETLQKVISILQGPFDEIPDRRVLHLKTLRSQT